MTESVPAGFTPYPYSGASYFQTLGELYVREGEGGTLVLGLRLAASHCNRLGIPHGGMLATLADGALGINLNRLRKPPVPMVTVNLSLDYLSSAKVGDWLEAHVTPRKVGRQLGFGDCLLKVGDREILRATGVFATVSGKPAVESDG